MKLNTGLRPCPFCTGIATGPEEGVIRCSECGAEIAAANDASAAMLWTARGQRVMPEPLDGPATLDGPFMPAPVRTPPGDNEQRLQNVTQIAMAIFPIYAMKRMFDEVKGESWQERGGMPKILEDAYEMAEAFVADAETRLRDARTADSLAAPADTETKSG